MRFAYIAIAFTLATGSTGFAPTAGALYSIANSVDSAAFSEAAYVTSTSSRSTSRSLLGSTKAARKFNAPAKSKSKSKGAVTEGEVRALFELWNSALATGDSRIVASRYTKVS